MTARQYRVLVEGVEADDLSLRTLRDLCDLLTEGAARSARLAAEGRSTARGGTAPAWIVSASDLHVTRFAKGSLDLGVQARPFVEVAPELFAQQVLSVVKPTIDQDDTALDLFIEATDDAASGRRNSDRLDPGVLEILSRTGALFAGSTATRLSISGGRKTSTTVLDAQAASGIRALAESTPSSRVQRVSGVLDQLTASTQAFGLKLDSGALLRGYAGSVGLDALKPLLGARVVIEGLATFRPSGDAARIELESVRRAGSGDVLWAKLPHVDPVASKARPAIADVGSRLDALFGSWPGDETDEELARALAEFG